VDKIRKISEAREATAAGVSGQGMDRRVEKKTSYARFGAYAAAGIAALLFAWWFVDTILGGRRFIEK